MFVNSSISKRHQNCYWSGTNNELTTQKEDQPHPSLINHILHFLRFCPIFLQILHWVRTSALTEQTKMFSSKICLSSHYKVLLRAYCSWTKNPTCHLLGSCRLRYQVKVNSQAINYGKTEVSHTVTGLNTQNTRYLTNTFTAQIQRLSTAHMVSLF